MGYRAHVITQEREYGDQTFSSWEQFTSDFMPAVEEVLDITANDNETFFEVEKDQLQRYVDTIPENDEESVYPDYLNKDLKAVLQIAINSAPGEWVSWEWF